MTLEEWQAIQEGLFYFFSPLAVAWVILALAGSIASIAVITVLGILRGVRL